MNIVKIEIDLDVVKERLIKEAVETTISNYFTAYDLRQNDNNESWEKFEERRERTRTQRLEAIVSKVDWEKFPEEIKVGILKKFVNEFFKGNIK